MIKPGGFLKKVFNPGNVAGKLHKGIMKTGKTVHKAVGGGAKAMGGIFGGGKSKKPGGAMGGMFAKAKAAKEAKGGGVIGTAVGPITKKAAAPRANGGPKLHTMD